MRSLNALAIAAGTALAAVGSGIEEASARVEAGILTCEVGKGAALILSAPRDLHCVFHRANHQTEAYSGRLSEVGLDVGLSGRGVIAWAVLAETTNLPPGELAGRYLGAEAGGAVAVGGEARALVHVGRGITLQPLSVEAKAGLNLAVGIAALQLQPLFRVPAQPAAAPAPAVGHSYAAVPHAEQAPHYGCGSYTHLQPGQTLSGVARTCGVTIEALLDANPDVTNVRNIPVGALINIPSHVGHHAPSPCGNRAILDDGESLDHLAWRCGVTLHALLLENPTVRDMAAVRSGLVLAIPEPGEAPSEPPVQYAMNEADLSPAVSVVATDEVETNVPAPRLSPLDLQPGAPPPVDRTRARLEIICVNEATSKYSLSPGDVIATGSVAANGQTFSVALAVEGAESVCLIDASGDVLYVSDLAGTIPPARGNATRSDRVPSQTKAVALPPDTAAMPASTDEYDATGTLSCSAGESVLASKCNFGVRRGRGGSATVYVESPSGELRTLRFAEGNVTTAEGGRLTWTIEEDSWRIAIDGKEYYQVSQTVVVGN